MNTNTKEEENLDVTYLTNLINQPAHLAESRFTEEELSRIKKEFDRLSKD